MASLAAICDVYSIQVNIFPYLLALLHNPMVLIYYLQSPGLLGIKIILLDILERNRQA
jgi:hypothetical protein